MGWFKFCGEQLGYSCRDVVLFPLTMQAYFRVHLYTRKKFC